MDVREKLVVIIQNSVGGCARHWAEVIADGLLANGVTVQEWISVEDRLPEKYGSAIVYRKSKLFSMLRYSPALGWHFYDSEWGDVTVDDVTHWMPLPQPPKGE